MSRGPEGRSRGRGASAGLIVAAGMVLGGCATAGKPASSEAALHQTIERLRVQNAAYARQVEELENRVFILSDQIESRRGAPPATSSGPELPRVLLKPGASAIADEPVPSADPDVEYAGEAAKSSVRRPVLRLDGDELPVLSVRQPPPTIEVVTEDRRRPEPRPVAPTREPRATEPSGAVAVTVYSRAREALVAGRHEEAAESFRSFLRDHPKHAYADNAQYWLAECFYDRQDFTAAVREFRRVVDRYPDGNKVADALLKIGFSQLALGSQAAGRETLEQVVRSYPKHEAAARATVRLTELERAARGGSQRAMATPGPTEGRP